MNKRTCASCYGVIDPDDNYLSDDGEEYCEPCWLEAEKNPLAVAVVLGKIPEGFRDDGDCTETGLPKFVISPLFNPTFFKTKWSGIFDATGRIILDSPEGWSSELRDSFRKINDNELRLKSLVDHLTDFCKTIESTCILVFSAPFVNDGDFTCYVPEKDLERFRLLIGRLT